MCRTWKILQRCCPFPQRSQVNLQAVQANRAAPGYQSPLVDRENPLLDTPLQSQVVRRNRLGSRMDIFAEKRQQGRNILQGKIEFSGQVPQQLIDRSPE